MKNFYPAISIEGFEEATDFRRGKGTYQATMRAMKILKEKKVAFRRIWVLYQQEHRLHQLG
ncbi:MAG: hypothetical protein ACLRT5_13475 [Lachnospiraceae bacterium]